MSLRHNMRRYLRIAVNSLFSLFGFRIIRSNSHMHDWPTFFNHLKKRGFAVKTVVDVGIATGTEFLYKAFLNTRIILIEPLREFEPSLKNICKQYNAEYILEAAGAEPYHITFNVTPELDWCLPYYHSKALSGINNNINGLSLR